jgi:hypothetical protein
MITKSVCITTEALLELIRRCELADIPASAVAASASFDINTRAITCTFVVDPGPVTASYPDRLSTYCVGSIDVGKLNGR